MDHLCLVVVPLAIVAFGATRRRTVASEHRGVTVGIPLAQCSPHFGSAPASPSVPQRVCIGADGRHDRKVTTDSPAQIGWGALTWSSDGRSIAYATNRTGNGDIYVIGVNGRNKVRLTRSSDMDIDPSWAPR